MNRKYVWKDVQSYYDKGHTVKECMAEFGFCYASWAEAALRGEIVSRGQSGGIRRLLEGQERGSSKTNRGNIKSYLLRTGILKNCCSCCGLSAEWQGKTLVMVLDHEDGDKYNYQQTNLRLLCPNCNSQMDTFAGKNVKKRIPEWPNGKAADSDSVHVGSIPASGTTERSFLRGFESLSRGQRSGRDTEGARGEFGEASSTPSSVPPV